MAAAEPGLFDYPCRRFNQDDFTFKATQKLLLVLCGFISVIGRFKLAVGNYMFFQKGDIVDQLLSIEVCLYPGAGGG